MEGGDQLARLQAKGGWREIVSNDQPKASMETYWLFSCSNKKFSVRPLGLEPRTTEV